MAEYTWVITNAGRNAIANNIAGGFGPVVLSQVGLGTGYYAPLPTRTALQNEFKRVSTISGGGSGNQLVVNMRDDSTDAYDATEIGLYTSTGVLFAVFSTSAGTVLVGKATGSQPLVIMNFLVETIDVSSVTFGDTNFVLNNASTSLSGIVELATNLETLTGTDSTRAVTPSGLKYMFDTNNPVLRKDDHFADWPSFNYPLNATKSYLTVDMGYRNKAGVRWHNIETSTGSVGVAELHLDLAANEDYYNEKGFLYVRKFEPSATSWELVSVIPTVGYVEQSTVDIVNNERPWANAATDVEALTVINNKVLTPYSGRVLVDKRLASQAEATTGTNNSNLMTPLRVYEQVTSRVASQAEATTGTNNTKLMTPLRSKQLIDSLHDFGVVNVLKIFSGNSSSWITGGNAYVYYDNSRKQGVSTYTEIVMNLTFQQKDLIKGRIYAPIADPKGGWCIPIGIEELTGKRIDTGRSHVSYRFGLCDWFDDLDPYSFIDLGHHRFITNSSGQELFIYFNDFGEPLDPDRDDDVVRLSVKVSGYSYDVL